MSLWTYNVSPSLNLIPHLTGLLLLLTALENFFAKPFPGLASCYFSFLLWGSSQWISHCRDVFVWIFVPLRVPSLFPSSLLHDATLVLQHLALARDTILSWARCSVWLSISLHVTQRMFKLMLWEKQIQYFAHCPWLKDESLSFVQSLGCYKQNYLQADGFHFSSS